jgi:hypothetical protein
VGQARTRAGDTCQAGRSGKSDIVAGFQALTHVCVQGVSLSCRLTGGEWKGGSVKQIIRRLTQARRPKRIINVRSACARDAALRRSVWAPQSVPDDRRVSLPVRAEMTQRTGARGLSRTGLASAGHAGRVRRLGAAGPGALVDEAGTAVPRRCDQRAPIENRTAGMVFTMISTSPQKVRVRA